MSVEEIKQILAEFKDNPDMVHETSDALDQIIRALILIEKKHLYQVEKTSVRRRREEVRKLLETELPKALGMNNDP